MSAPRTVGGGALTGGNGVIVSLILVAAALFLAGGLCAAAAATDAGEQHPTVVRVGVWALGSLAGLVSVAAVIMASVHVAAGVDVAENLIASVVGLIFAGSAVSWLGFFGMWAALHRRLRADRFW